MKSLSTAILFYVIVCSACNRGKVLHVPYQEGEESFSYDDAHRKCLELGGSLASAGELRLASYESDFPSFCSACGWISSKFTYKVSGPNCSSFSRLRRCNRKKTAFCYFGGVLPRCSRPLGMEQNVISSLQITSNSVRNNRFGVWQPWNARLNNRGTVNAWMPYHDDGNRYLEVDFGTLKAISGIITQGAKTYVTYFKISFSKNQNSYTFFKNGKTDMIFSGNIDNYGHKRNMFPKVILARYIRFVPFEWNQHISVRLEYLGCDLDTYDNALLEAEERSTPTVGVDEAGEVSTPSVGVNENEESSTPTVENNEGNEAVTNSEGIKETEESSTPMVGGNEESSTTTVGGNEDEESSTPTVRGNEDEESSTPTVGGNEEEESSTPTVRNNEDDKAVTPSVGDNEAEEGSTNHSGSMRLKKRSTSNS